MTSSTGAIPRCPLKPGQTCTLCVPGAIGPQDCGTVYLVLSDPELRKSYTVERLRSENRHGVRV